MTLKRRRRARGLALSGAALTVFLLATSAISYYLPWCIGVGRHAIGADPCGLALARSSHTLSRTGMAWHLGTIGSLPMGAETSWLPVHAGGRVINSAPGGAPVTATLHVLYIPLRPWIILGAAMSVSLWCYSRRKLPAARCPHCTYDLRGLTPDRCPECGHQVAQASALLRLIARLLPRPTTPAAPANVA